MKEKLDSILKEIYDTTPKSEIFQVVNELLEHLKAEAKKICRECGSTKREFYTRNRICKRCYSIKVQQKKKEYAQKHGFETYYQYLKNNEMENKINSKKSILIVGPQGSGKSRLAKEISGNVGHTAKYSCSEFYSPNHGFCIPPFVFSNCSPDTAVIVVDDCPKHFDVESFFNLIGGDVWVERRGKDGFIINPKFIFTSEVMPEITTSFFNKFEIIIL